MDRVPATPLRRYLHEINRGGYEPDAAQRRAVEALDRLLSELLAEAARRASPWSGLQRLFRGKRVTAVRGLYLWGGVGRGKTWLMDTFFDCVPLENKLRMHFHRFMRHLHQELRSLEHVADPLQVVADRLSGRAMVLCFDEFHVSDITDAMLLGRLLEALFDRGMTLVATSNEHPEQLYSGGLQRERFLPAIRHLLEHTAVLEVDAGTDYRLRYLDQARIYHAPVEPGTEAMMHTHFDRLSTEAGSRNTTIEIDGRRIPIVRRADSVVWFDFPHLCEGPRSATDYIEIARQFQTVLLGNVPCMGEADNDPARRFINLVDEFYDRNVRLIVSAAAAPGDLYVGQRLEAPFRRTASRLVEMQSHDYLARPHRPD